MGERAMELSFRLFDPAAHVLNGAILHGQFERHRAVKTALERLPQQLAPHARGQQQFLAIGRR